MTRPAPPALLALALSISHTSCAKDYDRFTFEDDTTASGMGGQPIEVSCGADSCDLADDMHCCVPEEGAGSGACRASCEAAEADLRCNEPADCPGQVCCLVLDGASYDSSVCVTTCGAGALLLCDPGDVAACSGGACAAVPQLPAGFNACD